MLPKPAAAPLLASLPAWAGIVGISLASHPCAAQTTRTVPAATAPAASSSAMPASAGRPSAAVLTEVLAGDERAERGEPNVKRSLIEDNGSKIDELRVRGQVQHVIVTPKVGTTKSYEIVVGRSGREPPDGTGGANNAVGKRVWNVLDF